MNAADRKYKADFLAKGLHVGSRVYVAANRFGVGTIVRIGGNYASVGFDSDGYVPDPGGSDAGTRVILFEEIEPVEAAYNDPVEMDRQIAYTARHLHATAREVSE